MHKPLRDIPSLCIIHCMSEQVVGAVPVWTEGDRLGKALDHAGIRHQEMADYLGLSRNTIGNYIHGRVAIDKRTRMLWAMRTGVPPEWLEHGEAPGGPSTDPGRDHPTKLDRLTAAKRARTRGAATTGLYVSAA
jgi:transcriptional regulator with XRE-family HTH domain